MHSPYRNDQFFRLTCLVFSQKSLRSVAAAQVAQRLQPTSSDRLGQGIALIITQQLGVMVSANQTLRAYTSLTSTSYDGWLCDLSDTPIAVGLRSRLYETTDQVRVPYIRRPSGSSGANVVRASSVSSGQALSCVAALLCENSAASIASPPEVHIQITEKSIFRE